jgi:hypothetical protein
VYSPLIPRPALTPDAHLTRNAQPSPSALTKIVKQQALFTPRYAEYAEFVVPFAHDGRMRFVRSAHAEASAWTTNKYASR